MWSESNTPTDNFKETSEQKSEPIEQTTPPADATTINIHQGHTAPLQQHNPDNKPGIIVLQWLTYAFWGWTIVAITSLLATTLTHMITGAGTGGFTPYGIAATLVLLPISAICDIFYTKHEPQKKTGAATIVMVIHAVLFALLGIASLIGIVFCLIQLFISSNDLKPTQVGLLTLLCVAVMYGITFVRVLNPVKLTWIRQAYLAIMCGATIGVIALSVVGPLRYERLTKNDRFIAENISDLTSAINNRTNKQNSLPTSLTDIQATGSTQKLVESKLVEYKPNTKSPQASDTYPGDEQADKVYFYQLCVTYARASSNYGDESQIATISRDDYNEYVDAYSHPAGTVCYKVATGYYNSYQSSPVRSYLD